jgi:hypothetical protein
MVDEPANATPVPWAQQRGQAQPRVTDRARRMVQTLPDWDPLPPGEITVRRGQER